jgi:hypothetical protein
MAISKADVNDNGSGNGDGDNEQLSEATIDATSSREESYCHWDFCNNYSVHFL